MRNFKEWLAAREATAEDVPTAPPSPATDVPTKDRTVPGFKWRYGNFCGPGPAFDRSTCDRLQDGKPLPQPMNAVDAACKDHDADYCRCGVDWRAGFLFGKGTTCSKQADRKLIKTLGQLAKDGQLKSHDQWIAAHVIKNYFKLHNWMQGPMGSSLIG
jgi:hypothetical protein